MCHPQKKKKKKPWYAVIMGRKGGFVRFGRLQPKEVGGTYSVQELYSRTGKGPSRETGRAYLKYSTLKGFFNHLPGQKDCRHPANEN